MLLAVDAGNTNIVFGIHNGNQWIHEWRYDTVPVRNQIEYEMFLRLNFLESNLALDAIDRVVVSSVVPQLNDTLTNFSIPLFDKEALMVGPKLYDKLPVVTGNPHEIGTDLMANAVAAHQLYPGHNLIVDFGTALTFTLVNVSGKIEGVNIAPGLKTAIAALVGNTAQLPEVPLELPDSAIGKDTTHAIQAGVLWGYVSMVEGMLEKIRIEFGQPVKVIATGGLSSVLHPLNDQFYKVNRHLTLEGLRIISETL